MTNQNLPAIIQQAIQKQSIDQNNVNVILPTQTLGSVIGEFDQLCLEVVTISGNPNDQEVFDLGKGQKCFTKVGLQKIGNALGIQWDPKTTGIIERGENFCRARATGALRKPNGEWISLTEEKEIDLLAIEEEQRIKAEESAEKGKITSWSGGRPNFGPWQSEAEKKASIELQVRKAVLPYRKFKAERAMTGAKERVIKALIAIKGTYTDAELSKPFAFPRIITDTNKMLASPELRTEAINMMKGSVSTIFGGQDRAEPEIRNVTEVEIQPEEISQDIDFSIEAAEPEINPELEEIKGQLIQWAESGSLSQNNTNQIYDMVNAENPDLDKMKETLKKIVEAKRGK